MMLCKCGSVMHYKLNKHWYDDNGVDVDDDDNADVNNGMTTTARMAMMLVMAMMFLSFFPHYVMQAHVPHGLKFSQRSLP